MFVGILIYNRKLNKSWKARDNATMFGDIKASNFTAQGVKFSGTSHINGIALSPDCSENRTFYFTPQTSFHIYSVPTWVLKDEEIATGDISGYITDVVQKPGATGGMVCDYQGNIYFGLLPYDAVAVKEPQQTNITVIEENSDIIRWPDTFAFDGSGTLFMSATEILKFNNVEINLDDINFRILKLHTGGESYYYCDRR